MEFFPPANGVGASPVFLAIPTNFVSQFKQALLLLFKKVLAVSKYLTVNLLRMFAM